MPPHATEMEQPIPDVVAPVKLHIVVAAVPFWGHLLPALRVAQGFAESGHSVTLFTSSCVSAGLAKAPESAGVRIILLDDFPAQDAVDSLISTEKGHVVFPTLENTTYPYAVKALAELHAREPIDHCVIDFVTFAFHKAARDCGLPFTVNLPGGELLLKMFYGVPTSRLYKAVMRTAAIWSGMALPRLLSVSSDIHSNIKGRPVLMHTTPSLMLKPWAAPANTRVISIGSPTVAGATTASLKPPAVSPLSKAAPEPISSPLPQELEAFLSMAVDLPVVLFTLGSMSGTMKLDNLKELLTGLRNGKWKTVIALNAKAVSRVPAQLLDHPNLLVCNWIPQAQVIADPRVHAVVTHCGWGASLEVVMGGKPIICLPYFGDQPINADLLVSKGIGIKLDLKTVKAKDFEDAVSKLLSDPEYSRRAQKLSSAVAAETRGRRGAVAFIEQLVAEDRARGGFQIKTAPSSRTSSSTALLRAATVAAVGAAALMVGLRVKKST